MPEPESFVVERAGCRIVATVRGAGEPVLFVQGIGIHGEGWRPQTEALAEKFRCVSFDNRGMGKSVSSGAGLTVKQMIADALAVMDAQGWEMAHVVGHSLGGLVALEMALTARGRVRSLALLNTFADGRIPARFTLWMLWVGMRTRIGTRRGRRRAFLQLVIPADALAASDQEKLAADLAPFFGHDLADQPPIVMKQFNAMKRWDVTARLGELAGIRTLVVSAAHDRIAPPHAGKAIAAGIPGARYIEYPDASHGLPLQFPERITTLLGEHFASTSDH